MKSLKRYVIFMVLPLIILVLVLPVSAQDNSINNIDDAVEKVVIDQKLTIEKTKDGRVKPVKNVENLSSFQLDAVLSQMNFSEEKINTMPLIAKKELVKYGGISVPLETTYKKYYKASDGTEYLITEENMDDVESLKRNEIKKTSEKSKKMEVTTLSMGSDGSGSFYGTSALTFDGYTSNGQELICRYIDYWFYDQNVQQRYTDKIAHAWQGHTTSTSRYGFLWYYILGNYYSKDLTISREGSVYGSSGKYQQPQTFTDESSGIFSETVRIPVTKSGTTGSWVVKYSHPWSATTPSVTIGILSVTFSWYWGDQWEWTNTFTIK